MNNIDEIALDQASDAACKPKRRGRFLPTIIIAALFLIGTLQALTGSTGVITVAIDDRHLGVDGTYGDAVFVELEAISEIQYTEVFDFGTCVDGETTRNTISGTYSCDAYGEYTVHAYIDEPCIIVHHPDGILVFNCGKNSQTEKMYEQLTEAMSSAR